MTPERWQTVKRLFDSAAELQPRERSGFLAQSCGGDASLREEVESLLASLDDADDFIEQPALTNSEGHLRVGSSLGPYRIVQVIGEGGMGTVYQAVRVDDLYRKLVAIKLVRRGLNSDFALKRFQTERQILAHLDHPNIAKLLDGGATPDGQPYFVMDFIAGMPIDEYCDANHLSVQERLTLFRTVCSAVHYAHQNLVVHRDLKPQNILITEDGTVRLLDFGIAKLLDPGSQDDSSTISGMMLMTPEFASPEQLLGEPVTTASDVYSLGILLYRLLTGHQPYQLKTRSPQEIWQTIRNEEPRRPSTVVRCLEKGITPQLVGEARGIRTERLARQLAGDLDNILLLALRKDPLRRYSSVEQFSSDLLRYLEQMPVLARPDTLMYRSAKFVRRHTAAVVAAALFAFALLGGIVATSWEASVARQERNRAERRFNDVRGIAKAMLFELHDAIEPLPGSTPVREILIKRAQQYLDHLADDSTSDDSLQRERALAYERIGDVLGLPSKANLGKTTEALQSYGKALELERAIVAHHPDSAQGQGDLARTLNRLCSVEQSSGRFRDALEHCGQAVTLQQNLTEASPHDRQLQSQLASTYQNMAGAHFALGDWPHSEQYRARALQVFEALHKTYPADEGFHFDLANAHLRMANVQEQTRHFTLARDNALHAIAMFEELSARHPSQVKRKLTTTYALQRLGSVLISLGDLRGAREAFLRSLPIREQILALDPMDASAQVNLSNAVAAVGYVTLQAGDASGALPYFQKQRMLAEKLVAADPVRIEHQFSLSEAYENLGRVSIAFAAHSHRRRDRKAHLEQARSALKQSLRIYDELRTRGAITAEYAAVPGRIAQELQSCEIALHAGAFPKT